MPRFVLVFVTALLFVAGSAWSQPKLHGSAAETQAVKEMRERLQNALARGDLAACRREGDNLARYGQADQGRAVIDRDIAAVEARLREVGTLFNDFRQIHDLNAQQAVQQAYTLMRQIVAKLASDAVTDVTVTLVTAPMPGLGKVVAEMGKQAADFLGNFDEAGRLADKARALRSLQALARYADDQMNSLRPAVREAENAHALLSQCRQQYQNAASAAQPGQAGTSATLDRLGKEDRDKLLYCACRCSTGCRASSGYSTQGFDASPSCKNPAAGPCFCAGFGCLRDTLKADCVAACLPEVGIKGDASMVQAWVDQRNREVGAPVSTPAPPAATPAPAPAPVAAPAPVPAASGGNLARGKPAATSSTSPWSRPNDGQGAVDGVKNGGFGFHTNEEQNPWWQVDLGASQGLAEVRLFNRLDCCSERSRTVQVMLSDDGRAWRTVYRHNGSVFGGADGKPLRVGLNGERARYLRLQLNERNWFHLDEVEVIAAGGGTASAPVGCANPQKVSETWNIAACGVTGQLLLGFSGPFHLTRLELWSDAHRAGPALTGQFSGPQTNLNLRAQRGGCQGSWCQEFLDINRLLPAGQYRLQVNADSLCQNPESRGAAFVRVYGCAP